MSGAHWHRRVVNSSLSTQMHCILMAEAPPRVTPQKVFSLGRCHFRITLIRNPENFLANHTPAQHEIKVRASPRRQDFDVSQHCREQPHHVQ
jgi:hypothetical protein